ncbi:MAG: hypothetical protein NTX53_19130 [candidate division WOR-3 bacterium]|nr:hypothetical protein [candidate division WOR-3 bacterium]
MKAYVVLSAVAGAARDTADPFKIPSIAFLDAKKLNRAKVDGEVYDVYVKVKVGEEIQERYLQREFGQFRYAYMKNPYLEKDMNKPAELCGSIVVIGTYQNVQSWWTQVQKGGCNLSVLVGIRDSHLFRTYRRW